MKAMRAGCVLRKSVGAKKHRESFGLRKHFLKGFRPHCIQMGYCFRQVVNLQCRQRPSLNRKLLFTSRILFFAGSSDTWLVVRKGPRQ